MPYTFRIVIVCPLMVGFAFICLPSIISVLLCPCWYFFVLVMKNLLLLSYFWVLRYMRCIQFQFNSIPFVFFLLLLILQFFFVWLMLSSRLPTNFFILVRSMWHMSLTDMVTKIVIVHTDPSSEAWCRDC